MSINDTLISLTPTEFALFHTLVQQKGNLVTKEAMAAALWRTSDLGDGRGEELRKYVYRVRDKLRATGCTHNCIVTVRSLGYRFSPPE